MPLSAMQWPDAPVTPVSHLPAALPVFLPAGYFEAGNPFVGRHVEEDGDTDDEETRPMALAAANYALARWRDRLACDDEWSEDEVDDDDGWELWL